MSVLGKRRRLEAPVTSFGARVRRPIDKELKVVNQVATTSVVATTLKTTTFPCTIVGLRWEIAMLANTAVANPLVHWAIVLVHDGQAASTPSTSDGADFYTPEQNVLAFGVQYVGQNDVSDFKVHIDGATKTMRKLKSGDLLQFITLSDVVTSVFVDAVVQFFCKS